MTGFSPEIAEELGDIQYLDPNGVNRRFIILTPEQENLPVVHTQFSNTAGLMHEFFDGNRRAVSCGDDQGCAVRRDRGPGRLW
jgi:hypothetical protein